MVDAGEVLSPLMWKRGALYVIDQRALPGEVRWLQATSVDDVALLIAERRIRGAAAIGCAAAYAVVLAARQRLAPGDVGDARLLQRVVEEAIERLRDAAPASVPVFWALAQMRDAGRISVETADAFMVADALEGRARAIQAEDIARCQRIGAAGAELLVDGSTVLTLGNHGALASGGWGTALGILRSAARSCRRVRVVVAEGRPLLDGARLTAWELERDGFDVTVVPDGAAPGLLARHEIGLVLLGADRISSAGDVIGELGSYGAALAAAAAAVPLVVAAPSTCIDPAASLAVGAIAPSALREVMQAIPERVALRCADADLVPGSLVGAIVTEHGIHRPPWSKSLRAS